jgi:ATP-dependent exoDNAse (exonuclease V) beta subunit
MARLFAAPDARADGRLQLMTIHKAKGLEFDTVILPGLHRGTPPQDAPLLAWDSLPLASGERLLVAPVNRRRRRGATEPTLYDFLQGLERERSANEAARVLYVAVTRAVRRLHLVAVASRKEDGTPATPAANSLLAHLWPVAEAAFAAAATSAVPAADEQPDPAYFVPRLRRLVAPAIPVAWRAPPPPAPVAREESVGSLAADVGTLVHALLEMAATDPQDWQLEALAGRRAGFARWLAGRGWPDAEARDGAERAAQLLATSLSSADGQWVLRPRADSGAEMAIARVGAEGMAEALCVPGIPLRGQVTRVVDRSFVEDGVRWIVDYKTTDFGLEVAPASLAAHAERYRAQLEAYAALFADEALPRRLAVFYATHGKLVSLN